MLAEVITRAERHARNMGQMAQRLGFGRAAASPHQLGEVLAAAARTCLWCKHGEICSEWLADNPGPISAAPSFCPNAKRFQLLR